VNTCKCGGQRLETEVEVIVLGAPGAIKTQGLVCTDCLDVTGPQVRMLASAETIRNRVG